MPSLFPAKPSLPRLRRRDGAPVAWFLLDQPRGSIPGDIGDVADIMRRGPAAIRGGNAIFVGGPSGLCLAFTDGLSYARSTRNLSLGGAWSVAFSIDSATPDSQLLQYVIGLGVAPTTYGLSLWCGGSAVGSNTIGVFDGTNVSYASPSAFSNSGDSNIWRRIVVTYDSGRSTRAQFFKDSLQSPTVSDAVTGAPPAQDTIALGGRLDNSAANLGLIGFLDNVQFYDYALTDGLISRDFADPFWRLRPPRKTFLFLPPPVTASLATVAQPATVAFAVTVVPPPTSAVLAASSASATVAEAATVTPPATTAILAAAAQVALADFAATNTPPATTAILAAAAATAATTFIVTTLAGGTARLLNGTSDAIVSSIAVNFNSGPAPNLVDVSLWLQFDPSIDPTQIYNVVLSTPDGQVMHALSFALFLTHDTAWRVHGYIANSSAESYGRNFPAATDGGWHKVTFALDMDQATVPVLAGWLDGVRQTLATNAGNTWTHGDPHFGPAQTIHIGDAIGYAAALPAAVQDLAIGSGRTLSDADEAATYRADATIRPVGLIYFNRIAGALNPEPATVADAAACPSMTLVVTGTTTVAGHVQTPLVAVALSPATVIPGGTLTATFSWFSGIAPGSADHLTLSTTIGTFAPSPVTLAATSGATIGSTLTIPSSASAGPGTITVTDDGGFAPLAGTPFEIVLPPVKVKEAKISPSRELLEITVELQDGSANSNLASIDVSKPPTLTVDGVDHTLDFATRVFGLIGGAPFVCYALKPEIVVTNTSVVTFSNSIGWATFAAGTIGVTDHFPVVLTVDDIADNQSWWKGAHAHGTTMRIGYNPTFVNLIDARRLANLANYVDNEANWEAIGGATFTLSPDGRRNLATVSGGTVRLPLFFSALVPPGNYQFFYREVAGTATITWNSLNGGIVSMTPHPSPPAGKVGWDLVIGTAPPDRLYLWIHTDAPIDQFEMYGPEVVDAVPAWTKISGPLWVDRMGGHNFIAYRDMDWVGIMSPAIHITDIPQGLGRLNISTPEHTASAHIVSVGPVSDANLAKWFPATPDTAAWQLTVDADLDPLFETGRVLNLDFQGYDFDAHPILGRYGDATNGKMEPASYTGVFMIVLDSRNLIAAVGNRGSFILNTPATTTAVDWYTRPTTTAGPTLSQYFAAANDAGIGMWCSVPINASDQYVTDYCNALNDPVTGLAAGRPVYFEFSNEVWNTQQYITGWLGVRHQHNNYLHGLGDPSAPFVMSSGFDWYVFRSGQIWSIAAPLMAAAGRPFYRVLGTQLANAGQITGSYVAACDAMAVDFDFLAVAPYPESSIGGSDASNDRLTTRGLAEVTRPFVDATYPSGWLSSHLDLLDAGTRNKSTRAGGRVKPCGYEGNWQGLCGAGTNPTNRSHHTSVDPSMYYADKYLLTAWEDATSGHGLDFILLFTLDGGSLDGGGAVWADYNEYSQVAGIGTGDGSNSPRALAVQEWSEGTGAAMTAALAAAASSATTAFTATNTPPATTAALAAAASSATTAFTATVTSADTATLAAAAGPSGSAFAVTITAPPITCALAASADVAAASFTVLAGDLGLDLKGAIVATLKADTALATIVGQRIFPGMFPQTAIRHAALNYGFTSSPRSKPLRGDGGLKRVRVRFLAQSPIAQEIEAIRERVRNLMQSRQGYLATFPVAFVRLDALEVDGYIDPLPGSDLGTHFKTFDVIFTVRESHATN